MKVVLTMNEVVNLVIDALRDEEVRNRFLPVRFDPRKYTVYLSYEEEEDAVSGVVIEQAEER